MAEMPNSQQEYGTGAPDVDRKPDTIIENFCLPLCQHAQLKSTRRFFCGSTVDILEYQALGETFKEIYLNIHIDQLQYKSNRFAFSASKHIPDANNYVGDILLIVSEGLPTGYTKLYDVSAQRYLQWNDIPESNGHKTKTGPAGSQKLRHLLINTRSPRSDFERDNREANRFQIENCETVKAVHSPYWPLVAYEWITRKRSHGFPSKSVMKQCLRYGCDFVKKSGSQQLDYNIEWRYSFSGAELFLARSWTISQKIAYDKLWLINKKIQSKYNLTSTDSSVKSNMCTYFFKTLMFWECERNPTEFWDMDQLPVSVERLLSVMLEWLHLKYCPNYFMRDNNMLSHFDDSDFMRDISYLQMYFVDHFNRTHSFEDSLTPDIRHLLNLSPSDETIPQIVSVCRFRETKAMERSFNFNMPTWIKRAFVIYYRLNNPFDTCLPSNLTSFADYHDAIFEELSDVFCGLLDHQKAVASSNLSELSNKQNHIKNSENHLIHAMSLCQSTDRDTISNCPIEIAQLISMKFMIDEDNGQRSEDNQINIQRYEYHTAFEEQLSRGPYDHVQLYKEWPSRSPTVNISWFVAKAYLANLYYTLKCDVSRTTKMCDEIIKKSSFTYFNERLSERTFPVVLSTQWTSIYDKEIQELLGFYSLCSNFIDPPNRSVYLGVCPVQFALYVKVRANEKRKLAKRTTITREYFKHPKLKYTTKTKKQNQQESMTMKLRKADYSDRERVISLNVRETRKRKHQEEENKVPEKTEEIKPIIYRCQCDDAVNNGLCLLTSIIKSNQIK